MSGKQQAAIGLTVAIVGQAIAHRAAAKQAAVLGIPAIAVAVLGWLVAQAIA